MYLKQSEWNLNTKWKENEKKNCCYFFVVVLTSGNYLYVLYVSLLFVVFRCFSLSSLRFSFFFHAILRRRKCHYLFTCILAIRESPGRRPNPLVSCAGLQISRIRRKVFEVHFSFTKAVARDFVTEGRGVAFK